TDLVVMHARILADRENATADESISIHQEELFTQVIKLAEREGKPVLPIVVPTNNAAYAITHTAAQLGADEGYLGISERYPPDYQIEQFAIYWGMVQADENRHITIRAIDSKRELKVEL